MKKNSLVVIGSSNTDMVVRAEHLPRAGETILGGKFFMNAGGKGANQAVAAARLGGRVILMAKTGNDVFGIQSRRLLEEEGIDTSYLLTDRENPSGVALITVDQQGENCIVVASGANATLMPSDLEPAKDQILQASIILLQLEIPLATVHWVVRTAAQNAIPVILNPAPACELPRELLQQISILTPNATEAGILSGYPVVGEQGARQAAKKLQESGIETVIVTLGAKGALVLHADQYFMVDVPAVQAVDTTAAGDVFNGALALSLSEGRGMLDSVKFACRAAAISVTRWGAQASIPYRHEVNE